MSTIKNKDILSVYLPVTPEVLNEAIRLASDKNTRVENLSLCISQDPVITLEILKQVNTAYFSSNTQTCSSLKKAITKLGLDATQSVLEGLESRTHSISPEIDELVTFYKDKCKRASVISKIITNQLTDKTVEEECIISSLFLYIGYIVTIVYLGENFISLTKECATENILRYQLEKRFNIIVSSLSLSYAKHNGMPQKIVSGLDRDYCKKNDPSLALIRQVVWSAYELVEAFDSDKWKKYAPSEVLPMKSMIRTLGFSEDKYSKIYEKASSFFISYKMLNDKKIFNKKLNEKNNIKFKEKKFDLDNKDTKKQPKPKSKISNIVIETKKSNSPKNNIFISNAAKVLDNSTTSENAITNILELLVDSDIFEKAAIMVVSNDKKKALVVCSRGPIGNGQEIDITDPLSPIAQSFTKVQSFGTKESENSPFGSKSYAIAPVAVEHSTPVILYADCGKNESLPFVSRRIFRNALDLLNEKLPELQGSIPVELKDYK